MMKIKTSESQTQNKIDFPWFLLGFILMSLIGSYVLGDTIPISENAMEGISAATTWILTAAMVGLGLNVNLKDLRSKALKPLLAVTVTSVFLSIIAYFII